MNLKLISLTLLLFCFSTIYGQWELVPGPDRSNVLELAETEEDIFLATPGAIFRVNLENESWEELKHPLISNVKKISAFRNAVYAVVTTSNTSSITNGDTVIKGTFSNGIWNWETVFTDQRAGIYEIGGKGDSIIFSGRYLLPNGDGTSSYKDVLFRSINNGKDWKRIDRPFYGSFVMGKEGIYALDKSRSIEVRGPLIVSQDFGITWTTITPSLDNSDIRNVELYQVGSNIFAFNFSQAFLLDEETISWDTLSFPGISIYDRIELFGNEKYWFYFNEREGTFYYSNNQGKDWSGIQNSSRYSDYAAIDSTILILSLPNRVEVSKDFGESFLSFNTGLGPSFPVQQLYALDNKLITIGAGSTFIGNNDGANWKRIDDLPQSPNAIEFSDSVLIGLIRGDLWISDNQGQNWRKLQSDLRNPRDLAVFGDNIFVIDRMNVSKFSLVGDSTLQLEQSTLHNFQRDAGREIIIKDSLLIIRDAFNNFLYSNDDGITFGDIKSNLGDFNIANVSLQLFDGQIFLISNVSTGILSYNENDSSWQPINMPGNEPSYWVTAFEKINDYFLVAIRDAGFFVSKDLNDWESIDYNLIFPYITAITSDRDYLYIGLQEKSIRKLNLMDLPDITTSVATTRIYEDISREIQIFPNPIKEIGTLFIRLPKGQKISNKWQVSLKDLQGRTLLTQILSNQNSINLNASDIAPGIYVLEFRSDNARGIKKLVIGN